MMKLSFAYFLVMTENMTQMSSYPLGYQQLSSNLLPQPGMQPFNSMQYNESNGMPVFLPYELPPPGTVPGYAIEPLGIPAPRNYEQQQVPLSTQNISSGPTSPPVASTLSYDAVPFQPQQMTPPSPTQKQTLQFIPSQVLRNIPK
jgi:hypothetical protein